MNKRQTEKIFIASISNNFLNNGYSLRRKRDFIMKFYNDMITVRIFPDSSIYYGEYQFHSYLEVKYINYTPLYKDFMREEYNTIDDNEDYVVFTNLCNIISEKRDFEDSINQYSFFINENFNHISNYIIDNFSTTDRLLSYLFINRNAGGVNRSLSVFILLQDTRGRDFACNWIRSGEPRTGSELQRNHLVYLNSLCQNS